MALSLRAGELCVRLEGRIEGDPDRTIERIRPPAGAGPGDLAYLADGLELPADCRAGVLLVGEASAVEASPTRSVIRHSQPRLAFGRALAMIHPATRPSPGVSPSAVVSEEAVVDPTATVGPAVVIGPGTTVGAGAVIGAGTVLGAEVTIGEECELHARVTIYDRCTLGRKVRILAGAVIGSDGFGFEPGPTGIERIPHLGAVRIEDGAEIGANCTVDRGVLEDTVIGAGAKLDNLVHIAHNCVIGPGTMAAAQVGIAGSTTIGAGAILAGQSGVAGHLRIGSGVRVGAKSAVLSDVEAGRTVLGIPAADAARMKRAFACIARLPEMRQELRALAERLESLLSEDPGPARD